MGTTIIHRVREFFIRNIVLLILFPLIVFILIFTFHGEVLHEFLTTNPETYKLYELSTLKEAISHSNIPTHIKSLAFDMVGYSFTLFVFWFLLFACYSYLSLSRNKYTLAFILTEFVVLILIYFFIVSPGLSIFIKIIGWFLFLLLAVMVVVYFLFFNQLKHEKK